MPDQLLMYCVENPFMIIFINSWSWGVLMVIRLVIDFGDLVKVALKNVEVGKGVGELRSMRAAGYCGPCVYLGVFLL
jgi:hypothetical protein